MEMSTEHARVERLEDAPPAQLIAIDNIEGAGNLATTDRKALSAVADWIKTFVAAPHKDLGRAGTVCPFVPDALESKTIWLAAERSDGRSSQEIVQLIERYKQDLLALQPTNGEAANVKSVVVVFPDLPAPKAKECFDTILSAIAATGYVEDGVVMGAFYEGNEGTAIYNPAFRPFTAPVPFLLMRRAVISDWKFFLNDEAWFARWVRRFGESAVYAIADELRRLPWRQAKTL